MPKAEVGSTKYVANKMKAQGLQRLRWYCQICSKQCRDENGFKQHTMSEGHVRAMLEVGEDPKKVINEYSQKFQRDFLMLLKTAHREKKVHMNNFYQEYIRDKEHIHMNATRWPSLTEFAKHLGREGICRVEEGERGLEISWIDNSAEAIQRREDIRKKDRQAKGDEHLESRLLDQQVRKAHLEAAEKARRLAAQKSQESASSTATATADGDNSPLPPSEPIKVSLSLKTAQQPSLSSTRQQPDENVAVPITSFSTADNPSGSPALTSDPQNGNSNVDENGDAAPNPQPAAAPKLSLSLAAKAKSSNPLAKKNPFARKTDVTVAAPTKKMSNAERIMREEMERKRLADERHHGGGKRQRLG